MNLGLEARDLLLSHPGVGNGKQQSLLDSGPDLIDIDTAGSSSPTIDTPSVVMRLVEKSDRGLFEQSDQEQTP
jgi:hypothetical protein